VTRTPTRCEQRRVYGITDSAAEGLFGGWSQAIYLEPGVSIAALPDGVPPETYISGGCGLITAVHAIERAALLLGDTVLVQGTGAVGLSVIALAKLSGASRVVAFGAPADRLSLATAMGADVVVDVTRTAIEQRHEQIRGLTSGLGVDVAIEAAGSARAVEEALDLIRDGGRYVIAGHYTDAWTEFGERPPADQSQAPGDPRLLGQRGRPLCAGAARARGASFRGPVAPDRRPNLSVDRHQSGACRRRSDADSESPCSTELTPSPCSASPPARIAFRLLSAGIGDVD
jgi:threonine dehydrogenase-like Zn-dependent dehydrogenase